MRQAGQVEVSLDESSIIDFFDRRARASGDASRPTVTMLQDGNAKVALQRNDVEVDALHGVLDDLPVRRPRTLDVGCGAGRLYFALRERLGSYVGIDGAPSLIDGARRALARFEADEDARFEVHDLSRPGMAAIANDAGAGPIELVLMSGILIYLNDSSTRALLAELAATLTGPCLIVMREPVGIDDRLTLKDHWSAELNANYNAIYRTSDELLALVRGAFGTRVRQAESRWLYEAAELNNRAETRQALLRVRLA